MEQHQMVLLRSYDDGSQLWQCPTCGRMFTMHWNPYSREIIAVGDENIIHIGGTGGLQMGQATVEPAFTLDYEALARELDQE